jgi:molybdenum cofactor cytidylyltransferase
MAALAPSNEASDPVIVLLAAGESRRFGGIKQLVEIDGQPMLRRAALTALQTAAALIVVTGAHAEQVEAALVGLALRIVRHEGWREGMGSSLAAGVRCLQREFPRASGVLVWLADQPLLDSVALMQLLHRHALAPRKLLATRQDGTAGPPALFPRDCFAALAHCSGASGARNLLEQQAQRVELFDACDLADVDTPDDLRRVRETLQVR